MVLIVKGLKAWRLVSYKAQSNRSSRLKGKNPERRPQGR